MECAPCKLMFSNFNAAIYNRQIQVTQSTDQFENMRYIRWNSYTIENKTLGDFYNMNS